MGANLTKTNQSRMLSLLRNLIATNSESPPGREAEVAKVLRNHMESHGIACESVGPSDRPKLIFSTVDEELGSLVLHGHMDTVPAGSPDAWAYDPFGAEIVDGRMYGRGACDMKGPVTALTETLILYSEENHNLPLLMLATSDEESGCSGAEEVAKSGKLAGVKFGVCAEPTNLDVLVGEKGMFWSRVVATGKAAHGSRPHEGKNAIQFCTRALDVLTSQSYTFEPDELMGKPTFSVGIIKGGVKINVVPDHCEAHLDMRLSKGQTVESVLAEMNVHLAKAGLSECIEVEYIHGKPAVSTPRDAEIVRVSLDAVERVIGRRPVPTAATFGTDCSVLQPKIGVINVICGPGSIEQAHQPDEYIHIDEMFLAVDVYLQIARHFGE